MSDETAIPGDESAAVAPTRVKGKPGRPRKARGASTADEAMRWSIRGVPQNVRTMAMKAADARGMTLGDFVSEAVVAYVRGDKAKVSGDETGFPGVNVPAVPIAEELAKALQPINERLAKLEEAQGTAGKRGGLRGLFGGRR